MTLLNSILKTFLSPSLIINHVFEKNTRLIIKLLSITCLLFTLSGCVFGDANTEGSLLYLIKREKFIPRFMRSAKYTGTPGVDQNDSYSEGFKQGCQNTTANLGQGSYRLQSIKIDGWRLTQDKWYLRGYFDASNYCTYMLDWDTH